MQWEVLIVPGIALAVWILTTIFRGGEDVQKPRQRPNRFDEMPRRRPERPPEDMMRRREAPARREAPPRREAPARAEPKRPTALQEAREPRPAKPAPAPQPQQQPQPAAPSATQLQTARAEYAPTQSPSKPVAVVKPLPTSPVAAQVRNMISSPKSAAVAFVLHEILDGPKCRRR